MILVEIQAGDCTGIGYTYADKATGKLASALLQKVVHGSNAFNHNEIWLSLLRQVRNSGECGVTQMAIAAIDNALWDLRGKLLNTPVINLLGAARTGIPVYAVEALLPTMIRNSLISWAVGRITDSRW